MITAEKLALREGYIYSSKNIGVLTKISSHLPYKFKIENFWPENTFSLEMFPSGMMVTDRPKSSEDRYFRLYFVHSGLSIPEDMFHPIRRMPAFSNPLVKSFFEECELFLPVIDKKLEDLVLSFGLSAHEFAIYTSR